jgi:hypothetical protein
VDATNNNFNETKYCSPGIEPYIGFGGAYSCDDATNLRQMSSSERPLAGMSYQIQKMPQQSNLDYRAVSTIPSLNTTFAFPQWPLSYPTGVSGTLRRFTLTGGVVFDKVTGLYWSLAYTNQNLYPWGFAAACTSTGSGYGNFADWRVPTSTELMTIWNYKGPAASSLTTEFGVFASRAVPISDQYGYDDKATMNLFGFRKTFNTSTGSINDRPSMGSQVSALCVR